MTRARKWLLGSGITVGVLIVVFFAVCAWLLYAPSGLRFALNRGVAMLHGQLGYASASGTLAGTTTIDRLRYRDASGDTVGIHHATLDLKPWALLRGRLHIAKARIAGITVDLATSQSPSPSKGFSLNPPLTIVLDDTLLSHITIRQNGKTTFTANSLALAGTWSRRNLVVRQLALHASAGSVELHGTLALAHGHRGHGSASVDWTRNGTRYHGTLTSQSDGKIAHLHATLSAPFKLDAQASLKLDGSHAWTLALAAPTFDTSVLPALPKSLKTLALNLRGSGNARSGKLTGSVIANGTTLLLDPAQFRYDGKTLTLDPLRLRSPQIPGTAIATGDVHIDATPMAVALDVTWAGVELPADLVGQKLATHGDVRLGGTMRRFTLKGTLVLGPPDRLSSLTIDLAGTPQTIDLHALKLVQQHGGLDVSGNIALQPNVSWNLDAVAKSFDPGAILAGWSGAMDFDLATQGKLTPRGPVATLKLDHTRGTLRGHAIAGSTADLAVTPNNLLQGTLLLVSGNSRVQIVGKRNDTTDAVVSVDIASLADWMPNAAGSLKGRFTLKGAWPRLAVAGQLHGNKLHEGARSIASLQLRASIPNIAVPGGNLDLMLHGVNAAGLAFDEVHLTGSGTEASHHVQLVARGPQTNIALSLDGSWQASARRWAGSLHDVELAPHGMPAWRQQAPSRVTWQNGHFSLSQFCLSAGNPHLCLEANRNARGVLTARYSLQQLPLQLLASLVPLANNPLQASGDISGTGQLSIAAKGALTGRAQLSATPGNIAFASNPGRPLLAWTRLGATATASGTNQHVMLQGDLDDGGRIHGDITASGTSHALHGIVDIDLRSLAFLEALSPELANVQGALSGRLRLFGSVAAPRFQGRIQTRNFSAELPRAGLKLHNGQFVIAGDAQGKLTITGQITSGNGVLHVTGSTGLGSDAPLNIDLKGDNVLVADIPAANVVASPDLRIARAKGVFAVTGSVTIPSAKIEAAKLPGQGPAHASPDVVIVDAPPTKQVAPLAMQADIDVKLGDHVEVQGYGFDGSVHGQLAVRVRPGETATGRGEIRIDGKYQAYGQNLTIKSGRLLFAGTRLDNPGLDVRAVRDIRTQDVIVGLRISGTAQRPVLTVFSDPAMEQAEALSYLVTGRPLNDLKSGEGNTLNTAAQALGGLAGDRIAKSIGARLGLEAGVSSSEALGGSAFTAGKYLSPRLFLSYGVGLFTPGQVITLRYTLNRFLQFEAENATTGNRASLNYKIEK